MQSRPKFSFNILKGVLVIVALVTIGFSIGYKFSTNGGRLFFDTTPNTSVISRETPNNVNFSMFWQVWDLLRSQYYDQSKLIDENLVYGAIKGMVAAVGDPYTVFLSKSEQKVTQEDLSGTFSGVGIQIGYKGTQLAVIAPLPGSPAEKAGIKPGDLIIGIKDEAKKIDKSTDGMSLPEAVQIIRGDTGSKVTLALLRENEKSPIIVDVERENIDVPSVSLDFVGEKKDIAHIRIQKFGAETKDEWDKSILQVLGKSNIKGVILDVRSNPGGYLQAAVDIATDFLDKGTVVVAEEYGNKTKDEIKTETNGRLRGTKVVVLINGGSASASEILSGAMRDDLGAKLVGEKSFGKGTVQEPREFPDGTGIHVTIAKWLTPNGTWVHGNGLDPDVKVSNTPNTQGDAQLDAAVKLFN